MEPVVRLIPLGGLGEIGLNMMLIESGDDLIAVDCGLMFPDDELPGIDHVIPDFTYALARRSGFRAVVLTHGHEDHIGALPYLLREAEVPVYGTPLTLALVAERLREHGLAEGADLRPIRPRQRIEAGPFSIEPIRVTHSIADGIGLAIDTPAGTIVHTGDFKLDPSPLDGEAPDYQRFAELGERGVLVLCSDSTNVERPGHTPSEMEVGRALGTRFDGASGRIILATFASHIHRIQQVLTLAARTDRRVALLGMSMQRNVAIAADLGKVGITVQTNLTDLAGYLAGTKDNDIAVTVYGNSGNDIGVASLYFRRPPTTYQTPADPRYAQLLQEAEVALDADTQNSKLKQLMQIASDNVAGAPIAYLAVAAVSNAKVHDISMTASPLDPQHRAWIEA